MVDKDRPLAPRARRILRVLVGPHDDITTTIAVYISGGRDGEGSFDPRATIPGLSFDGTTDVYTFRFDDFSPDDFIKIRLNSGFGNMAPGFGGLMFDLACDYTPNADCGNGVCNQLLAETCESCPEDCGACPECGTRVCPECDLVLCPEEAVCPRCGEEIKGHACPNCHADVALGVAECPSCGQPLCPDCGAAIGEDDTACAACGAELALYCSECDGEVGPEDTVCPHCGEAFRSRENKV